MAALAETRDVESHLPLPRTVRRLCCIGDSITYGQGVTPQQTLAMHIARFANMVYPEQLIWVDNRGQSSGNIWHSWAPFVRLAGSVHFDAVVFSICENDAQILESNTVRYGPGYNESWLCNGQLRPAVRDTFVDIARLAAEHGICLILDFFTYAETSASLVQTVAEGIETSGLPFVHLLDFFTKESGLSIAEYIASPFDGHPSDAGHRAAARRIVEELRDRWTPTPPDGGTLSERLVEACDQAVRGGRLPDDVYYWGLLVLEAKEIVARRLRTRPVAGKLGDLARARATIEDRYRVWYAERAAAARTHFIYEQRDDLWRILESAYASIRNLDEMTFIVEHFHGGATASELWTLIERAGYYTEHQRLQALPPDLKAKFLSIANSVIFRDSENLPPPLREAANLSRELRLNLQKLAALLPNKFVADDLDPSLMRLWQVTVNLVNAGCSYLEEFRGKTRRVDADIPGKPVFFTNVDVWVERDKSRPKRGGVYNLTVEADYVEPSRSRRRSKLWAGADEDDYIYRFEMPLLLLGDIGVGVPAWDTLHQRFVEGELRLARVEISNFLPQIGDVRPRFVWEASATSGPVHWLKFERLLVPD